MKESMEWVIWLRSIINFGIYFNGKNTHCPRLSISSICISDWYFPLMDLWAIRRAAVIIGWVMPDWVQYSKVGQTRSWENNTNRHQWRRWHSLPSGRWACGLSSGQRSHCHHCTSKPLGIHLAAKCLELGRRLKCKIFSLWWGRGRDKLWMQH